MKFKTTKKEMRNGFRRIIRVGYCDAQNLLRFEDAIAYSSGYYGWSCDYYNIDGIIISTGYSPIGNYEFDCEKLNEKEKIVREFKIENYSEFRQFTKNLLREFIQETINKGE